MDAMRQKLMLVQHLPGLSTAAKAKLAADGELLECKLADASLQPQLERLGVKNLQAALDFAEKQFVLAAKKAVDVVTLVDDNYPKLLRETTDPPLVLYTKGNLELFAERLPIAVVGARKATSYGVAVTERFVAALDRAGFTIVSGLARGIDGVAHATLFKTDDVTRAIGVLGCGIDVIYPRQNRRLFEQIVDRGLLVSELPLGAEPLAFHFPMRNRIISGLSLAALVVEAGIKSGSLITARLAAEQGRQVFAVPHAILNQNGAGNHQLIREGATLVSTTDELIQELSPLELSLVNSSASKHRLPAELSLEESRLMQLLHKGDADGVDALVAASGLPSFAVISAVSSLEIQGLIERAGDGKIFVT